MSPCAICGGRGYLLDQTHGQAVIPAGWTPVQACDACSLCGGDDEAALFAGLHYRVPLMWFDGPVDEDGYDEPGDYAIQWVPTEEETNA